MKNEAIPKNGGLLTRLQRVVGVILLVSSVFLNNNSTKAQLCDFYEYLNWRQKTKIQMVVDKKK